jgi:hypothetical protein
MQLRTSVYLVVLGSVALATSGPTHAQSTSASNPTSASDEVIVDGKRSGISGVVGNTIVLDGGGGLQVKVQLRSDGTFRSFLNREATDQGTWKYQDGLLCYKGDASRFCVKGMDGKTVGDMWISISADGRRYKARLVAGQ